MKKMWKRFVSLLLACTLLAGMLPLSASAAEKPGKTDWISGIITDLEEQGYKDTMAPGTAPMQVGSSDVFMYMYQKGSWVTDGGGNQSYVNDLIVIFQPGNGDGNHSIPDYTQQNPPEWSESKPSAVYFADGVTGIGNYAFASQPSLNNVVFQDASSLTYIGQRAFYDDDNAVFTDEGNSDAGGDDPTRILDLSHVEKMGEYAFYNCDRIKGVELSGNITAVETKEGGGTEDIKNKIPNHAFNNSGLQTVNIPEGIVTIGDGAFAHTSLSGVGELVLPNGLQTIGDNAFVATMGEGATSSGITSLTIPSTVTSIGVDAFSGRRNLQTVTVEDDGEEKPKLTLGDGAFGFNEFTAYSKQGSITDENEITYNGLLGTTFYLPADLVDTFKNGENCFTGDISPMEYVDTIDPTCTTNGYHIYRTTISGAISGEGQPVVVRYHVPLQMLGHDLDGGTPVLASCETGSYTLYKCQRENCSYTESKNIQDDATDHKYTIQSVSNLAMGNGTETVFTWECQQDGHSQERDGKPKDVSITVNPPAISADTTMTVGDLKMPEVDGGTLTLAASENPDEELTTQVTSVKVVFTPDPVTYAGYTGMREVSGFGDVELTLKVDVNKAELDFSDVNFGNTRVFVDSTASEGTPITVYRGSLPEDVTYGPPLYSNDTGHNENTPPPRNSTWSGTVSVTFIYDPDKYEVDAEKKPGVDYTFDAGTPGKVTITHSYVIVEQSMDDLAAAPISPLTYKANTPQDTVLLSGVPYSSTVSWTWEEVGNQSNNGQGTETSPSDRNAMDIAPITDAGTYRVTITVEKDGFTSKTLDPITVTIAKATVTTPTAASDLQYTGKVQTGLQDPAPDALYKYVEGSQLTGTNAGPYTATAQLNDSENYRWSTGDDNGDGKVQISWNIAKRRVIETSIGTNYKSVPYIGNAYTAVGEPPRPSGLFTVTYREDGTLVGTLKETHAEAFTITNAQQTNAGTYEVIATITDFDNFYWQNHSEVKSYSLGTWTINPLQINAPTITAENATYTGEAYAGKVTLEHSEASDSRGSSQDIIDLDDTNIRYYTQPTGGNSGNAPVNAGTYYAGVESDGWAFVDGKVKTNYRIIGGSRAQFSISKATAKMTFGNPTETKTYTAEGTALQKVTVNGLQGDDATKPPTEIYSVTYTYRYRADDESEWENEERKITNLDTFVFTDVGQYQITAKWGAGKVSNNYTATDATYTLTITQADDQSITLTPDEKSRWTAASGSAPAKYTIEYGQDATFTVIGKAALDDAEISYEVKDGSEEGHDGADADVLSVDTGNGTVTIEQAGTATITVTAADTDNVAGTSVDYTVTVSQATPTVSLTSNELKVPYTGQPITGYDIAEPTANVVEEADQPTGTITYTFYRNEGCTEKFDDGAGGNVPIAVGTYYMQATYPGDKNYTFAESEVVTVTVTEAKLTVKANGYTDTYDGDEHDPASITVTGVNGTPFTEDDYTVSYIEKGSDGEEKPGVDDPNWDSTLQVKDVAHSGDYWFKVVIKNDDSYNAYIGSVTVDIDPKQLTVTKTVKPTKEYDGTADADVQFDTIATEIPGESVTADSVSAVYDSPNANVDNFITITYQLTAGPNTDLDNYSVSTDGGEITEEGLGKETVKEVNGISVGIDPAPITVDIKDQEKVYDGSVATPSQSEWSVDEGKLYDVDDDGIKDDLGITLTVVNAKNAGKYAITGTANNSNYAVTFAGSWAGEGENKDHAGTYTITPRPIKVEIGDAEGFYGDAPVKPSGLLKDISTEDGEGLVEGDSLDQFLYHVVINASPNTDVGSHYTITGTSGEYGNYNVTFASGTYTVNPRPITITIKDHSSKYGAEIDDGIAEPVSGEDYTVAITNEVTTGDAIVNSDDLGIALSTTANKDSNAGTYPISGEAKAEPSVVSNYAITWAGETPWNGSGQDSTAADSAKGTYTIDKAQLKVSVKRSDIYAQYGEEISNPVTFTNASTGQEIASDASDYTALSQAITYGMEPQGGLTQVEGSQKAEGKFTVAVTQQMVTVTVNVAATENYEAATAITYRVHASASGSLDVSLPFADLTYNGQPQQLLAQAPELPDGVYIRYKVGEKGAWTEYSDADSSNWQTLVGTGAGDYTVYWETKAGGNYNASSGHETTEIKKADLSATYTGLNDSEVTLVLSEMRDTYTIPLDLTSNKGYTHSNGDGVTFLSGNTDVAIAKNSTATLELRGVAGEAKITINCPGDNNYNPGTFTFTVTVTDQKAEILYDVTGTTRDYNGQPQTIAVKVTAPASGATVMYWNEKTSAYDLSEPPAYTDVRDDGYTIKFQITAPGYNTVTDKATLKIEPKDINQCRVEGIAESYTYVGHQIQPETVAVVDDSVILTKDTDYTLKYGANQEVGEDTGTVTIKGKGNYTGKVTEYFDIIPVDGSSGMTASIDPAYDTYNSPGNTATVTVTHQTGTDSHEVTLTAENASYTITATDLVTGDPITERGATGTGNTLTFTKPAIYDITLKLTGDHQGEFHLSYTLLPLSNEDGGLTLTVDDETQKVFTYGDEIDSSGAAIKVTANNTDVTDQCTLTYVYTPFEGTPTTTASPYTAEVLKNAGVYTVTATPKDGSAITGTGTFTFLILQRDLAEADLTVEDSGLVYNQNAQEPAVTVEVTGNPTANDYEVTYYNNVNASDDGAKAVVTAKGNNFTGSKTVEFTIAPKPITGCVVGEILDQHYTGEPVTPPVTITDGNYTLILGYDYTTACTNKGPGAAKVTITGTGNYTGTTTKDFVIKSEGAPEPSERFDLAVRPSQWTWGDDLKDLALNVTFGTGNELDLGTEYTLEVNGQTFDGTTGKTKDEALTYIKGLKPDEYTITATGVGAYNGSTDTETVTIQKIQPEVTVTATPNSLSGGGKVTLTLKGEKLPAFAEGKDLSDLLTVKVQNGQQAPDLTELEWTENPDGSLTAELTLPNTSETYTFTLTFTGNEYYEAATASEQVVVAQQIISGGGGGPVEDQPANPDDTGVSDWLNTKEHLAYLAGYPGGTFGPDQNMTRAEAAQMFYNLLLEKDVEITVEFEDVPADAWYAKPVNTLASLGILSGVGNGRFDPERSITRAEFTVIAMKFANTSGGGVNIFSDVNEDDWFYSAVVDSTQYGWINGYPDGTFRPEATISRAEVTVIVNHMLGRAADRPYVIAHEEELNTFGDVNRGHWGYFHVAEATNAHEYHTEDGTESWTGLS